MAAQEVSNTDANDPVVRLLQYIFVGKEYPDYQPGDMFVHNYFLAKNVPSIQELAEDPEKELLPVQYILKSFESQLVPNPETLIFVLAVCCRQMKSERLRRAAYALVKHVCVSPQHFILFIKFASKLSKHKELDPTGNPKAGWGSGIRTAVNHWYLSKDPLELAKCVTRYKGRYGWKHKDIIKLSHPHSDNPEIEVVLKYILRGLEETKKAFGDDPRFKNVIQHLVEVEDFKHCVDESRAARLLEMYKLTLDHVPGHLLKSKEVWDSLIPSMNLHTLLNNLLRIHNLGFLKPNSETVCKIVDQITNEEIITRDKVHPALVLITIRNYEKSGKPLSYEKRKMREQIKNPWPTPLKPYSKITDALYRMLNLSFSHLQPTGLRYMVTINMNKIMLDSPAWRNGNLTGAEAGCMIVLSLLRSEKNVTVATFKNVGVHTVNIDKTASFGQAMRRLQQMPVGNVNVGKPMSWAAYKNNKYDVFINIVEQILEKTDTSEEALIAYKTKMKLPNTKLINCSVCTSKSLNREKSDKNILTVNGFDETVPLVIQAFAKSLF